MSIKSELRQQSDPCRKSTGQDIDALERFMRDTRHMIVFDVLAWDCPVGDKGQRVRIFLTDEGYTKALESERRGEMKIVRHARVRRGDMFTTRRSATTKPISKIQALTGKAESVKNSRLFLFPRSGERSFTLWRYSALRKRRITR